jgi:RimJ/RimL family protein N-acetyltransferase
MTPRSLAWRTDLIFTRFDGEVVDRGDCLVVRTPSNPGFWWGNFLLLARAPSETDAQHWLALFETEVAQRQPESRHLAFGIDDPADFDLPVPFVAAGLTPSASTVLTMQAHQLRAPRTARVDGMQVAELRLPEQAAAAADLQVACDAGLHRPLADYRLFRERQMQRYGAMAAAGRGAWFGAFVTDAEGRKAMVADCGLFREPGEPLGRFQHVETHPAWRRRGLCSALIHSVCRHGFERLGLTTLVIVADPDDVAIALYESIGFERGARIWQLERPPLTP